MRIIQAIDERHAADPQTMLTLEMQNLYKMFTVKEVEDVIYTVVLAIAGATGCFYKIEEAPNHNKGDCIIYFWSRSFGEHFPQIIEPEQQEKQSDGNNTTR